MQRQCFADAVWRWLWLGAGSWVGRSVVKGHGRRPATAAAAAAATLATARFKNFLFHRETYRVFGRTALSLFWKSVIQSGVI